MDLGVLSVAKSRQKQDRITSNMTKSIDINDKTTDALAFGLGSVALSSMISSGNGGSFKGLGSAGGGGFLNGKQRAMKNTRNKTGNLPKLIGLANSKNKKNKKNKNSKIFKGLL